jgi:hypothetical protein
MTIFNSLEYSCFEINTVLRRKIKNKQSRVNMTKSQIKQKKTENMWKSLIKLQEKKDNLEVWFQIIYNLWEWWSNLIEQILFYSRGNVAYIWYIPKKKKKYIWYCSEFVKRSMHDCLINAWLNKYWRFDQKLIEITKTWSMRVKGTILILFSKVSKTTLGYHTTTTAAQATSGKDERKLQHWDDDWCHTIFVIDKTRRDGDCVRASKMVVP